MKHKHLRQGIALALSFTLLTACGMPGAESSQEKDPAESAAPTSAPQLEAPQTTASPVEQTGYGYVTGDAIDLGSPSFQRLVLMGDSVLLLMQSEDAVTLEDPDSGESHSVSGLSGTLFGASAGNGSLWCGTQEGSAVTLSQLSDAGEIQNQVSLTLENAYPTDLAVDGRGYFYLLSGDQVLVYSSEGKSTSSLKLSGGSVGMRLGTLEGGQVVLTSSESGSGNAVRLLTTESIGRALTDSQSRFVAYSGYQALLSGGGNLYAMNPEDSGMETLLNWVDSGVDPGTLTDCAAASAEKLYYVTSQESGTVLGTLTRVAASELPQRETVSIGVGASVDSALTARITALAVAYNESQQDTHLHLVDYSLYSDGDSRLTEDAGDLDLVIGDDGLLSGVALQDLKGYYDDQVGESTLLSGVQKAAPADRMPMSFCIETLAGSSTLVGEGRGWTTQEFADTVSQHTDIAILKMCNSYDALNLLLQGYNGSSEELAPLLTACAQIPVEDGDLYSLAANSSADSESACLKAGTLLLSQVELGDFMDLRQLSAEIGDTLTYKGYPQESGNGTVLRFPAYLAIPEGSQHGDAAWAFLKQVISGSGDFLGSQGLGFPVLEQDFRDMAQAATQQVSFQDEEGNTVTQDPTIWVDGVAQTVSPFTQQEIDELISWLGDVSGVYGAASNDRLTSASAALKSVLESGVSAQDAAKDIAE